MRAGGGHSCFHSLHKHLLCVTARGGGRLAPLHGGWDRATGKYRAGWDTKTTSKKEVMPELNPEIKEGGCQIERRGARGGCV